MKHELKTNNVDPELWGATKTIFKRHSLHKTILKENVLNYQYMLSQVIRVRRINYRTGINPEVIGGKQSKWGHSE